MKHKIEAAYLMTTIVLIIIYSCFSACGNAGFNHAPVEDTVSVDSSAVVTDSVIAIQDSTEADTTK
jgi:phosphatidylglycerophosphatase A